MDGYIAVTDHGWYEKLAYEPGPRDVNFWRPSTRAFRLVPGTPFFFKLKAPYNAVVGFGYFVSFTVLPDWLAWETFGAGNGVADLETLRGRLHAIQKGARIASDPGGRIGCCLLAESRFFGVNQWVAAPRDWKPRTQTGAGYDLSEGEGLRVWQECLERVREMAPSQPDVAEPLPDGPRYGEPTLHRPRLGQGIFRIQVLDAYDRACAVTSEHSLPVLEAAHIKPYSCGGVHEVPNGITLRTDLHRLFDRGYVTLDDNCLVVGKRLREDFANGRSYYGLHGKTIVVAERSEKPAVPGGDAVAPRERIPWVTTAAALPVPQHQPDRRLLPCKITRGRAAGAAKRGPHASRPDRRPDRRAVCAPRARSSCPRRWSRPHNRRVRRS